MISEDRAKALFQPIQQALNQMILESWKKIHRSDLHFKSRSRASLMWDEIFYLANIAWCDSEHINKIEEKKSQTAHYWLDNKTLFRIKKGDEHGYTRNYPTQTALEFHEQQSEEIFDLVDKMEVTYVLSQDETKIIDIAIVHRNSGIIDFRFSILSTENVETIPHGDISTREKAAAKDSSVAQLKFGVEKSPKFGSSNEE